MDNNVYILSGCRTAIGSFTGQYSNTPAITLGSCVIREAIRRANIENHEISEVIMGQVLTAGLGQNPARQAAFNAGIPHEVPAYTLNMVCGSGLNAVYKGFNSIKANESSIAVCGGMENMSLGKHCVNGRCGKRLGSIEIEDTVVVDGLTDVMIKKHMGETGEYLVKKYEVTRFDQDCFALDSQKKAQNAIINNYFKEEIIGVKDSKGNVIEKDEYVRFDTSIEALTRLKPIFEKDGTITAGNASGLNDGAAALVICSGDVLKSRNLKPFARIVAFAQIGLDPNEMGLGPIKAIQNVTKKANWSLDEVDLFEINEAFAVQSILVIKALNIDLNKVNVNGGAISLGHPIGCSGTRVIVTLLYNMLRLKKNKGIASVCIGGGMGLAIAVQMD